MKLLRERAKLRTREEVPESLGRKVRTPMIQSIPTLTLEEFLKLPESNERYELVAGELLPKVSPQTPHSRSANVCSEFSMTGVRMGMEK